MKQRARLIIPAWGDAYADKLVSVTLPALLAPGNLPILADLFDVEFVIVTETRLFDSIRNSPSFRASAKLCPTRLAALDDLMTDTPGDYGAVLTYALFRGFSDLGARMTEAYLVFLNADFVVSDGSLGHLASLMSAGKRVIHAPSFRVTIEEILPQLRARVDETTSVLSLAPRDMVALALAHKHRTVKARIVNQRFYHQSWMDQYYWYVDEKTLIGYQWPVALVAIRPERVATVPTLVWDYGFVPEAAPTARRHFIGDSDDFFMIELQGRDAGAAMIRVGWISFDDIARNLSMWTTKEQRECGRQLLKIHAGDLPDDLDDAVADSQAYMAEIYRRLPPQPLSHIGHSYLGSWFDGAKGRMRGARDDATPPAHLQAGLPLPAPVEVLPRSHGLAGLMLRAWSVYRRTFGSPPTVSRFHPLWADLAPITSRIAAWRHLGAENFLWVSGRDTPLYRFFGRRVEPAALLIPEVRAAHLAQAPYDACVCELTLEELFGIDRLYAELRPLVKDGGRVIVCVVKRGSLFDGAELLLESITFPRIDISEIHFYGSSMTGLMRAIYTRAAHSLLELPLIRGMVLSAVLVLLAPAVRLANAYVARRDSAIFSPTWTSLIVDFTIKRARLPQRRAASLPGPLPPQQ